MRSIIVLFVLFSLIAVNLCQSVADEGITDTIYNRLIDWYLFHNQKTVKSTIAKRERPVIYSKVNHFAPRIALLEDVVVDIAMAKKCAFAANQSQQKLRKVNEFFSIIVKHNWFVFVNKTFSIKNFF